MSDNVIKTEDLTPPVKKKTPAKKAAPKKTTAPKETAAVVEENPVVEMYTDFRLIVFESGASYTSDGYRFTQAEKMQEVPANVAEKLLILDNFRLPNQFEIEEYLNSKRS